MFKRKGGGGPKAFWTMLKKTALFLKDGFPNLAIRVRELSRLHNWNELNILVQHFVRIKTLFCILIVIISIYASVIVCLCVWRGNANAGTPGERATANVKRTWPVITTMPPLPSRYLSDNLFDSWVCAVRFVRQKQYWRSLVVHIKPCHLANLVGGHTHSHLVQSRTEWKTLFGLCVCVRGGGGLRGINRNVELQMDKQMHCWQTGHFVLYWCEEKKRWWFLRKSEVAS